MPAPPAPAGTAGRHVAVGRTVREHPGRQQYLWRAVDQDGDVIDILLQPRRDRRAAERFFRKLLKGQGRAPRRLMTDKLRSDSAAHGLVIPPVVHSTQQYENNRAEVSHQPTRQRERPEVQVHSSRATILVGARARSESFSHGASPVRPCPRQLDSALISVRRREINGRCRFRSR